MNLNFTLKTGVLFLSQLPLTFILLDHGKHVHSAALTSSLTFFLLPP